MSKRIQKCLPSSLLQGRIRISLGWRGATVNADNGLAILAAVLVVALIVLM
jgi:hypothetical protein